MDSDPEMARATAQAAFEAASMATTADAPAASAAINWNLYPRMLRDLRSYALWMGISGISSIAVSGTFSAEWGVILLVIAGLFLVFQSAEMLVVDAGVFVLAAIGNFAGLQPIWIGLGLLQFFWGYQCFRRFRAYLPVQEAMQAGAAADDPTGAAPKSSRAARAFPWLSVLVTLPGLFGVAALMLGIASATLLGVGILPRGSAVVLYYLAKFGTLGLPFGISSLMAHHPNRAMAIAGTFAGTLVLLGYLGLLLLSLLT